MTNADTDIATLVIDVAICSIYESLLLPSTAVAPIILYFYAEAGHCNYGKCVLFDLTEW